MTIFVVTYKHPNETGWSKHVLPHVLYLQDLLKTGALVASGPFLGGDVKSAMLLMSAPDRESLISVIAQDPFAIEGLIEDMTITEWDPMFGALMAHSSRAGSG
ncbi:MAG: hypothetical protein KBA31_18055 [Alphaproteobacteria bacterium]|nr:hypothetical protein [Alphaproteobacteria bacterium]